MACWSPFSPMFMRAVPLAAAVVQVEDVDALHAVFRAVGFCNFSSEVPVGGLEMVEFVVGDSGEDVATDALKEADRDGDRFTGAQFSEKTGTVTHYIDMGAEIWYYRLMLRTARIVVPEVPHHITQRGNNKQDVFFVDDDRYIYLELLGMQGAKYGLHIAGYCLMTNHVHVIGTPAPEDALAKTLGRTHFLYTQYINCMHHRSGHLWQNRVYSCAMEDDYFLKALCKVIQGQTTK